MPVFDNLGNVGGVLHGDIVERQAVRGHVVALTISGQQFATLDPQYITAILCGAGAKCYTCVKVYFDRRRDDRGQRALCSGYYVDICRPSYLTETLQEGLHLAVVIRSANSSMIT